MTTKNTTITNINLSEKEYAHIKKHILKNPACQNLDIHINLFKLKELDLEVRTKIRSLINSNPEHKLVLLSSKPEHSLFAWRINAFYFIEFPINDRRIYQLSNRMVEANNSRKDFETLKISYSGGVKLIHPSNINIIRGKGNYCDIYSTQQTNKMTFSIRIQKLSNLLSHVPYLVKLNSSTIANINNLTKLEKDYAFFKGSKPTAVKISRNVNDRLKKELHWINT